MIRVTRAQPQDVTTVLNLRKRLYVESAQAAGNGHLDSTQEWRAFHDILGMLLDPFCIVLVAWDEEKAVGMLALSAGPLVGYYKENSVTVTWAYVDPAYRDKAVMLALHREGEKAIIADGPVTVHAMIRTDNKAVLDSALSLGYTVVAVTVERKHGRRNIRPAHSETVHRASG